MIRKKRVRKEEGNIKRKSVSIIIEKERDVGIDVFNCDLFTTGSNCYKKPIRQETKNIQLRNISKQLSFRWIYERNKK